LWNLLYCSHYASLLIIILHHDDEEKKAKIVVSEQQLSLAIGKQGQNVRLAAKLTGYGIDIKSSLHHQLLLKQPLQGLMR